MVRCIGLIAIVAGLAHGEAAIAQIDPDDDGIGTELGMTQRHNSGQVGTVTLVERAPHGTLVMLRVFSAPTAHTESAQIRRGHSCASLGTAPAYRLAPVTGGVSQTIVAAPAARLLSGNYVVDVYARSSRSPRVSCGELYR